MADLQGYRSKRDLSQTPEPSGERSGDTARDPPGPAGRRFVVQRHAARRLHYDLRLEREGVLASWALPRGLPIRAGERHLAVQTEDHPVDYLSFEGEIPAGNYGAGRMDVWDSGHYEMLEQKSDGGLTVALRGVRAQGVWTLVPARLDGDEANWLVLRKDAPAAEPRVYRPTLATTADVVPAGGDWIHEIKWDGYRAICHVEAGEARLVSRGGQDMTQRFESLSRALPAAVHTPNCVLDGEVCALDEQGRPRFGLLQSGRGHLAYFAFDLLEIDGSSILDRGWQERRDQLERVVVESSPLVRRSEVFEDGEALLAAVREQRLEGIVSKRRRSPYADGRRTAEWLKVKPRTRERFAVVGFTPGRGRRERSLGALILAESVAGELRWVGNCGTGFSDADLVELMALLKPRVVTESPLGAGPPLPRARREGASWVQPGVECEVDYVERTEAGLLRAASYRGLGETEAQRSKEVGPVSEERTITRGARSLSVRNLTKVFWPADGLTKGDLVDYYEELAPTVVPHLRDRPFTMKRFPNGIEGKHFFQKDAPPHMPDWIRTRRFETVSRRSGERRTIDYPLVNDDLALIWMASMGCIDLNVPLSRVDRPDRPDMVLFDLDPSADSGFRECVRVARLIRDALASLELRSYVKTSGSDGIHVLVPIARRHSFADTHLLAATVAGALERLHDGLVTTEFLKRKRRGVLIDAHQNGPGRTIASVYSVRPHPRAPVSVPLEWDELSEDMDPHDLTMEVARRRVAERGDLFRPVLEDRQSLGRALRELG